MLSLPSPRLRLHKAQSFQSKGNPANLATTFLPHPGTKPLSDSSDLPFSQPAPAFSHWTPRQAHSPSATHPRGYLGMTGHWSARGWQEWGGASESEGRGQVYVAVSKPHPAPLSNRLQAARLCLKNDHSMRSLKSQGGHSWAHPFPLGTQKITPTLSIPHSPFRFCISPALQLSSYIYSDALISGLLSFRPS